MAVSMDICRLDEPGYLADPSRFRFSRSALGVGTRGPQSPSLLDYLVSLNILEVVAPSEVPDGTVREVQVLVSESRLAHWCVGCDEWERRSDEGRFILTHKSLFPGYDEYLCEDCFKREEGLLKLIRFLTRYFYRQVMLWNHSAFGPKTWFANSWSVNTGTRSPWC
ncbi:hypothetical protein C8J56DRAFT_103880 [Mycena floridula]|nr:hypothetical protein C8J56DRAFT_103880 [Mycena floridula]